jgi:hypothetical protein
MEPTLEQLQYPVGRFEYSPYVTDEQVKEAIGIIASFPFRIMEAVKGLTEQQLDTPYRPDGWTIRQVEHHTADSHMNAYIRFKLALTEENPTIRPYLQAKWAELIDSKEDPQISFFILIGVHQRWVDIMEHMSEEDWNRKLRHPEHELQLNLRMFSQQYKWHCQHHLNHILQLRKREGF